MRSSFAALPGSMTCAKSLTGSVSVGRGCAYATGVDASRNRSRAAQRERPSRSRSTSLAPPVDVRNEPLDGVEIRREQPFGIRGGDFVDVRESDDSANRTGDA